MRIKIRVFPDYCASGFWGFPPNHSCLDASQFSKLIPESILIAVCYWHLFWEMKAEIMSKSYQLKFDNDGQRLVDEMNEAQDVYEFVYVPSFKESIA